MEMTDIMIFNFLIGANIGLQLYILFEIWRINRKLKHMDLEK